MPLHVDQMSSELSVDAGAPPAAPAFQPPLDDEDRAVQAQERRRRARQRIDAEGFDD